MKTVGGLRVTVALVAAGMSLALVGRAEKPPAAGQQDAGQQEKRAAELAMVRLDNESPEGQEAKQKLELELVAADGRVVKGKPYSADTSTETVQTLADGNRIVQRTVSKIYRDSDGRTRREQTFGNVDPEHPSPHEVKVFVDDPVNGTAFVMDQGSKSVDAVKRARPFLFEQDAGDESKRALKIVKDTEDGAESGAGPMVVRFKDDQSGGPLATVIDDKRNVAKEDLGTRTIEGVDCSGTRKTITIAAGTVGNEKPITIVTETWYAQAISAVVQSTTDDPRYGKTTYQLTNVQLSEPARSLFEPPANFKMDMKK